MTYKRSNVQLDHHAEGPDGERLPCVNVKAGDFGPWTDMVAAIRRAAEENREDVDAAAAWYVARYGDTASRLDRWWESAAEEAWGDVRRGRPAHLRRRGRGLPGGP